MAVVDITIKERISSASAGILLVCNNPTDIIRFVFDAEWSSYELKTARFSWENKFIDVPFTGNSVKVPEITNTQYVFVGVYAKGIASTPIKLDCKRSILCLGNDEYVPPEHTYWDEFENTLAALNKAAEDTNQAASRAESAANAANTATSNAQNAAKAANDGAILANAAAESANTAAQTIEHKAPAIVPTALGEAIVITDASDMSLQGLRVFGKTTQATTTGKNLMPNVSVTSSANGVQYTVNEDGSVLVIGTATQDVYLQIADFVLPAGSYILNGETSTVNIRIGTGADNTLLGIGTGNGYAFSLSEATTVHISLVCRSGSAANCIVYPMIRLASNTDPSYEPYTGGKPSPSPDYPQELVTVGAGGSINAVACGANLLRRTDLPNGFQVSQPGDAAAIMDGYGWKTMPTADISRIVGKTEKLGCLQPGVIYTLSFVAWADLAATLHVDCYPDTLSEKIISITPTATKYSWTFSSDLSEMSNAQIRFFTPDVLSYYVRVTDIQLEVGSAATAFTAYADGGSVTASTPNGLPGIPVTSGGNYTDASGQQWLCDEIDFGRGVYVQRVGNCVLNGTENWALRSGGAGYFVTWAMSNAIKPIASAALIAPLACTAYQAASADAVYATKDAHYIAQNTYAEVWISKTGYDSVDALKAYLAENPITVMYALATPVETSLSAEEIAAYRAMHTNKPTTTITNDAGAYMEVSYNADTKTYIDNKFAELAAALINNV